MRDRVQFSPRLWLALLGCALFPLLLLGSALAEPSSTSTSTSTSTAIRGQTAKKAAKASKKKAAEPRAGATSDITLGKSATNAVACASQDGFPCITKSLQSFRAGVFPANDCARFCGNFAGKQTKDLLKVPLAASEAEKARGAALQCLPKSCSAKGGGVQLTKMLNNDMANLLESQRNACKCGK